MLFDRIIAWTGGGRGIEKTLRTRARSIGKNLEWLYRMWSMLSARRCPLNYKGSLPARAYIFSHITSRFFFAAAVSNSINGNAL